MQLRQHTRPLSSLRGSRSYEQSFPTTPLEQSFPTTSLMAARSLLLPRTWRWRLPLRSNHTTFSSSTTIDPGDTVVCPSPSSPASKPQQENCSHRLASVADAINERKLPRELRGRPNAIRSETDIENVVEHRVCRAMEEGHFENLPGKGKPLKLDTNPHIDPAEDTLYRILSRNGCAPEWVELNKEIRAMIKSWRSNLKRTWGKRSKGDKSDDDVDWLQRIDTLKKQMNDINSKVLHYNLIVPFGRQMCGLRWEKEVGELKEPQ